METYLNAWTPVKAEREDDRFAAEVWGRRYEFINSALPTQITSLGKELLYSPVKLTPVFGDEEKEWVDFDCRLYSANDETAVFITSQAAGNVICDTAVTVEYDGFVKIDLKLLSSWQFGEAAPKLTGLYMDVPLKKEHAGLMHYWPNDRHSIIQSQDVVNSGETEDVVFPFKPYFSFSDTEVGLGIFCGDSDENLMLNDPEKCVSITDCGEYVNLRLTLLEQMPANWLGRNDRWVATLKPVAFTVGFHAMPVKPMKAGNEVYKVATAAGDDHDICKDGKVNKELLAELKKVGLKQLYLHENWSAIQNFGFPYDEAFIKEFVKEAHASGIKIIPYFGYEFSTLHPEWSRVAEDYLMKNTDGEFTGGWQRKPHQRAYMVCYQGGYSDEMIERVCYVMDELGMDGIYTDGTYIPWECANTNHGCGYTDKKGQLHATFPILAVREHVKKLYAEVHKRGGTIDTHQSACCIMPLLSFCDTYYDGENIQKNLKKEDMSFLNPAAFRAEYMGINFGIPANFLAAVNEERPISALYALSLLHNVHCRTWVPGSKGNAFDYCSAIWSIFDRYDLDNAKWYPYWDKTPVTAEGNAMVSVYEAAQATVAVCADFSPGTEKITLHVPKEIKAVKNLLTSEAFKAADGKAEVATEISTLNILLLER